jgi:ATP-dependent DNA helicase RecQ
MPTGGGKINLFSITRITISRNYNRNLATNRLDEDQVDGLKANGIEACFINSSQTETKDNFINLKSNVIKLVYCSESLSFRQYFQ